MLNTELIFNIVYTRLGNHAHVGISSDSSVTLLVTHPDFLSAIRKIDHNKNQLTFQSHYERTDDETSILHRVVECMRECQLFARHTCISLLHPDSDDAILLSLK